LPLVKLQIIRLYSCSIVGLPLAASFTLAHRSGPGSNVMPSAEELGEAAKIAYQAFVDMSQSKVAHFDRLAEINAIYEAGGAPSLAENLELEKLLAHHDKNVLAFKTAYVSITDDAEKQLLIELMS